VSKRAAWIAGVVGVLVCAVGLTFLLKVVGAHSLMHAAEGGDVDKVLAAVDQSPKDAGLWVLLGDAYSKRSDYAQAVRAYQKALQLNPSDESTWWLLGIAEVCRNNPGGIAAVQGALQRLNGESAKEFARLAELGCCAFGGCAK